MRHKVEIAGKKFGKLTVIKYIGITVAGRSLWECKCECGNITTAEYSNLKRGHTTSCGCVKRKHGMSYKAIYQEWLRIKEKSDTVWAYNFESFKNWAEKNGYIDGARILRKNKKLPYCFDNCYVCNGYEELRKIKQSNKRLLTCWRAIIARTTNKNIPNYQYYGGRGITVCDEWQNDFQSFYDWAIANGYKEGLTIDRINNDGNYEPSNCRWATLKEQANNRQSCIFEEYQGQTKTLAQWADEYKLPRYIVYNRYRAGWNIDRILTTQIDTTKRKKGYVCK